MEKRYYIQPNVETETLCSEAPLMQIILGSPTAPEPGMAPKIVPHVNIHTADTVQVF